MAQLFTSQTLGQEVQFQDLNGLLCWEGHLIGYSTSLHPEVHV